MTRISISGVLRAVRRPVLAAFFLLLTVPALAQNTRVDTIAAKQAEKAQHLAPEAPNAAERAVARVMSSPLLTGSGGVYPWFGSVYPGAGFGGGVGYLGRYPRRQRVSLVAAVSVRGSTRLDGSFSGPALAGGTITPRVSGSLVHVRGLSFFGGGPDSIRENRALYDYTPLEAAAGLTFEPVSFFSVDVEYRNLGFETNGEPAPIFPLASADSFGQKVRYHAPRATVAVDWRPSSGYAARGGMVRATLAHYEERRNGPWEFRELELEAIQLVPLVREQFVLAFRGLATFADAKAGHAIPFVLLPTVGSGSTVRGYPNRRFADENRLVLTGEYRWQPSRYIDMAIFMDAGHVAPDRDALALNRLRTSWGIGARLHGPTFSALRFDVARSREGLTFVVAAGGPF